MIGGRSYGLDSQRCKGRCSVLSVFYYITVLVFMRGRLMYVRADGCEFDTRLLDSNESPEAEFLSSL